MRMHFMTCNINLCLSMKSIYVNLKFRILSNSKINYRWPLKLIFMIQRIFSYWSNFQWIRLKDHSWMVKNNALYELRIKQWLLVPSHKSQTIYYHCYVTILPFISEWLWQMCILRKDYSTWSEIKYYYSCCN